MERAFEFSREHATALTAGAEGKKRK